MLRARKLAEVALDLAQWVAALMAAQGPTRNPDQSPREALRLTRVLQVDLERRVRAERLATQGQTRN